MRRDRLRARSVSDVHLLHPRVAAENTIRGLEYLITDPKVCAELQLITIVGDLFDRLAHLGNKEIHHVFIWLARLLQMCAKFGIVLRVLKGTPSHDYDQPEIIHTLLAILEQHNLSVDCKYVDDLSVEYIESLDLKILYIPDNCRHTTEQTLIEAKQLLNERGWDQVDLSLIHGYLTHQVPKGATHTQFHDTDEYLKLTRYLILGGHVHQHSVDRRAVAHSSVDRYTHGDETPKGGLDYTLYPDGNFELKFIENPHAMRFESIACYVEDINTAVEYLLNKTRHYEPGSYLRVQVHKGSPLIGQTRLLAASMPLFRWTIVDDEVKVKSQPTQIDERLTESIAYDAPVISQKTVAQLLEKELAAKGYSESKRALELLQSLESY